MYEYRDDINGNNNSSATNGTNQTAQIVTKQQLKAIKKAEAKVARKKFWKKVGAGLLIGVAFGVASGCAFIGITRTVDHFFPADEKNISQEASNDKKEAVPQIPQTPVVPKDNHNEERKEVEKEPGAEAAKITEAPSEIIDRTQTVPGGGMDVTGIVKSCMPSIVSITNKGVQEVRSMFGMGIQQYESVSVGSGIIIGQNDEELLIVTNNHVVEAAKSLTVGFVDEEVYEASVKGTDPDLDLAVVAVKISDLKKDTIGKINVATLGDSDELLVGEQVVAIGNALGYGQSVTTGIVSALNRDITDDNTDNPLIQTDAAINPGNSGGALLNMRGELVGINSAKIASTEIEGVGYAIPISSVEPIIETLMTREQRDAVEPALAGYIGISGVSVDSNTSSMYGIPVGVYIQTVEEGSPAEKAGLIKGDVVRKFDGITVSSITDIRENLDYYKAGETVDLIIYRQVDGEYVEKTIAITLGSREGTALDPNNFEIEENQDEESEDGSENGNNQIPGFDPFSDFGNGFFSDDGTFGFRFGY